VRNAVVIGGGLAGLAAARDLAAAGVDVTVLEAGQSLGGRMRTVRPAGLPVDVGAAFFTDFYPRAMSLIDACGMRDELIPFSLAAGVERDGTITPIWPPADFLRGRLLPPVSLLRLLVGCVRLGPSWRSLDPGDLTSAAAHDTRTADSWARAVLGDDVADNLIAPVLRGVVHWELATTSQAVLFSMVKAVLRYRGGYRLVDGMASLCDRLGAKLAVRCSMRVSSATRSSGRWVVDVRTGHTGERIQADGLVCATTASAVSTIFPDLPERQRAFFDGIRYSSTAIAVVRAPARSQKRGTSILFADAGEPTLAGITPAGIGSVGDTGAEIVKIALAEAAYRAAPRMSDEQLGAFILGAARRNPSLSGWLADAAVLEVVRWPEALPVFDVGHLRRVGQWRAEERPPFLAFAGDYLAGPHLEGAVRSGANAAAALLAAR
jgi:oxygen-dependent protoporphyrinogen oxidase